MIIDLKKYTFPTCELANAFVEFIHLCNVTYAEKTPSKFTLFVSAGKIPYDVFDNSLFDKTIPLLKRNKNFILVEDFHSIKIFNLNYISQISLITNEDNALLSSFVIQIETAYYETPLDIYLEFTSAISFLEALVEVNNEIEIDSILKELRKFKRLVSNGI